MTRRLRLGSVMTIRLERVTKLFPGVGASGRRSASTSTSRRGTICVLIGPSGCGKTTTMRMVNRLIEPTAGRILVGGERRRRHGEPVELRRLSAT